MAAISAYTGQIVCTRCQAVTDVMLITGEFEDFLLPNYCVECGKELHPNNADVMDMGSDQPKEWNWEWRENNGY